MNLNDDNRPIIAQRLNYAEMAEKMQNDLNNNKENKNEQEKEKVKTNEEKQSTCCFIF